MLNCSAVENTFKTCQFLSLMLNSFTAALVARYEQVAEDDYEDSDDDDDDEEEDGST